MQDTGKFAAPKTLREVEMIKLIASDIDGTLLDEGCDNLNPELFEVIRKLKDKGVMFAAASGRQYASIRRLFEEVQNDIIFIAENGAYVVCRGMDMQEVPMERTAVEALIRELRTLGEDYPMGVSAKDYLYVESKDTEFRDLLINGYHNEIKVVDDILAEDIDIIKVSVYHKDGIDEIADPLIARWKDTFYSTKAGALWVDFMDFRADKGQAIQKIQELMRILPEECMAFGDNHNDIGMLKSVGESYAIGNAREEVKAVAKYVADTNRNDGVLKVLKRVLEEI